MWYRGARLCGWTHSSCCVSRLNQFGRTTLVRTYSAHHKPGSPRPPAGPAPPDWRSRGQVVKERARAAVQHAGELGRQWGQRSRQAATATMNHWWERYEEFVGINEVRKAQSKVTEAEAAFMVARGMVREANISLEALQVRLKEVQNRLDRMSREEAHYLELATLEHKLLQEERHHRTAYENAQSLEREKFALFSAGVRESHEKERTRAERTKNWSIIGSVLGAVIGVIGSTYINRVRLQELKTLLLEAQKGPESLQEGLGVRAVNHHSQQDQLQEMPDRLRVTEGDASTRTSHSAAVEDLHVLGQRTQTFMESLPPQLGRLEQGLGRVEGKLSEVKRLLDTTPPAGEVELARPERAEQWEESEAALRHLEEMQRTLGDKMRTNTIYNALLTYTAAGITIGAICLMLKGAG